MKLGISSQCYDRAIFGGKLDFFSLFEMCRDADIDGIELEDKHFVSTEPAYLDEIKAKAAEANLIITDIAFDNNYGLATPEQRQQQFEKFRKWLDVGTRLQIPLMRVFSGFPANDDPGLWDEMIKYLKRTCALAEGTGVIMAMENHNHGGFAKDSAAVLRIFDQVDAENLRLCLDTGNYIDGIPAIEKTAHLAVHVHAKIKEVDAEGKEVNIDYETVFRLLRAVNYGRFVSLEYEGDEDEFDAVPRAIRGIRKFIDPEGSKR